MVYWILHRVGVHVTSFCAKNNCFFTEFSIWTGKHLGDIDFSIFLRSANGVETETVSHWVTDPSFCLIKVKFTSSSCLLGCCVKRIHIIFLSTDTSALAQIILVGLSLMNSGGSLASPMSWKGTTNIRKINSDLIGCMYSRIRYL